MTRVKGFREVIDLVKQAKGDYLSGKEDPAVIDALAAIAREDIGKYADTKRPGNDTGNQFNAYGWGVYFQKQRKRQGYVEGFRRENPDPQIWYRKGHKSVKVYGRLAALKAVQSYVPEYDGYVLYICNAMWYSLVHEDRGMGVIRQAQGLAHTAERIDTTLGVPVTIHFLRYPW